MSNEWNWHVNSLQSRLSELQNTIDSIKTCVERRPGLDAATRAIGSLIESASRSEKSLYEFPSAMSQILSDPAIGAILSGPGGEIVLYNSTAEEILGREYLRHKDLKIRGVLEFSSHDKTARLGLDELPWTRALRGETVPDLRMHVSRPGQPQDTWINASATPFKDQKGTISGLIVFLVDTTEEVQLESNISLLCNNIHEQIAQVGSTHGQLRELAEKLSNTGIQRILSESGPPSGGGGDEDVRKKSQPRRDEVTETSPTRTTLSGSQTNPSGYNESISTPSESPSRSADSSAGQSIFNRKSESTPPSERPASNPFASGTISQAAGVPSQTQPSSTQSGSYPVPPVFPPTTAPSPYAYAEKPAEVEETEAAGEAEYSEEGYQDEESGAVLDEHVGYEHESDADDSFEESADQSDEELDEDSDEEELDEEFEDQEPAAAAFEETAQELHIDETSSVTATKESSDFWIGGFDRTKPEDASSESVNEPSAQKTSDVASDSPESLFGKLASLTRDSEEAQAEPTSEPDSALPWPELVDGQDAGEPLWEEYTNNEEESAPWDGESENIPMGSDEFDALRRQQESNELSGAYAMPKFDQQEPASQADSSEDANHPEPGYARDREPEEVELVSEEVQISVQVTQEYTEPAEVEELGDDRYTDEDEVASGAFPAPYAESVDDTEYGAEPQHEYALEGEDSQAIRQYDEVSEADEEQSQPVAQAYNQEIEAPTPAYHEASSSAAPEVAEQPAWQETVGQDSGQYDAAPQEAEDTSVAKPTGMRGAQGRKTTKASGSYTRLQPLSTTSELDEENFLEEGLSMESHVVRYNADDSEAADEVPGRVLVVDDIPVNQKLLLLHLKRLGYEADVANNGQEALDMLAKTEYGLILMDCDMPVMNGFEAATRIRSNEAYSHRRIPIIALTSYDRDGDKEKCIAAGMDDYITKGASQKELKETIERSIVSARQKSRGGLEAEDEEVQADIQPLDITSMLKLYGKEEVEEISKLFLSNMGTYIECMQLAIDKKDADSVAHFANAVKGPCAALGMRLMTRLTTDIMAYAESEDWTQVRVKYMRLKAVFVQTREELKKVCPDDSLLTK